MTDYYKPSIHCWSHCHACRVLIYTTQTPH